MRVSRRAAARLFAAAVVMPLRGVLGQPAAEPEFDVASVKPIGQGGRWSSGIDTMPGRILGERVTLKRSIMQAYGVGTHQVLGGPEWMGTERWRIEARAASAVADDAVLMKMLQGLLADRFQLAVHRETRMLPAYLLEVGRGGPKMQRTASVEDDTDFDGWRGALTLTAKKTGMDALAEVLGSRLDRPVVNRTGLAGGYNFTLHWSPANGQPDDEDAEDVSIFTAVPEQLGLRLRTAKAPVEVVVIDRAERPAEN